MPLSHAHILGAKAKANPGQIKAYDNRDDRIEIANLLGHLEPRKRVQFFAWACSKAILPGTRNLHPLVGAATYKLLAASRHCDRANEQLTIDILQSLTHMWIDYQLDARDCLTKLEAMARGKA